MATAVSAPAPAHGDRVYCHECHSDWYRDEHGLVCPNESCRSDFVEIIENGNDPRGIPDLEFDEDDDDDEHNGSHGFPHRAHHHHHHQHQHSHAVAGFSPLGSFGAAFGGAPASTPGASTTVVRAEGPNFSYVTRTVFHAARGGPVRAHAAEDDVFADLFSTMLRNIVGDSYNRPEGANRDDHPTEGTDPQHPRHHGQEPRLNPRDADAPQAGDAMPVPDIQTFLNSLFGPVDGDGMSPLARFFNNGPGAGGDYVYSQSELDRIISQLMEQHQGNAPPPAQKEDIARLPRIKVTQAMVDDAVDCAVCKEDLLLDEEVTVLPCKHSYHFDCVSKWLEEHDTCPICRHPITPPENRQQRANNQRQSTSPGGSGSSRGGASGGRFGGPFPGGFPYNGGMFGTGSPPTRSPGQRPSSAPGSEDQNQDTQNHSNRAQSPPTSGQFTGFPGSFPNDNDEENRNRNRNRNRNQNQNQQNQNRDGGSGNGPRTSSFANLFRRRNS